MLFDSFIYHCRCCFKPERGSVPLTHFGRRSLGQWWWRHTIVDAEIGSSTCFSQLTKFKSTSFFSPKAFWPVIHACCLDIALLPVVFLRGHRNLWHPGPCAQSNPTKYYTTTIFEVDTSFVIIRVGSFLLGGGIIKVVSWSLIQYFTCTAQLFCVVEKLERKIRTSDIS